jgi:hypothetical protein
MLLKSKDRRRLEDVREEKPKARERRDTRREKEIQ